MPTFMRRPFTLPVTFGLLSGSPVTDSLYRLPVWRQKRGIVLDTAAYFDTVEPMKGKVVFAAWVAVVLFLVAVLPAAAQEREAVFLPGWVAWATVIVSLAVPVILYFYLRGKGRL